MWETLDLCINIVDMESLDQLIPRLTQLVRGSVGLNTRSDIYFKPSISNENNSS